MATTIQIADSKIRVDKTTGFICLTDIGNAKDEGGGTDFVKNWLRSANTIAFIIAWEARHSVSFKRVDFDPFKQGAGTNSFRVSAGELIEAGATGIITKKGRYGGTYCTMDWTIHFANWLDPEFYVETIHAFRKLSEQFYGRDALYQRFSREIVAGNYGLITQGNAKRKIPRQPHALTSTTKGGDKKSMVKRRMNQVDADIINLAIWKTTASDWRSRFPKAAAGGKNLRDHATQVELHVINALQILMRHLQEDNYTAEEKLDRLSNKAIELTTFYCNNNDEEATKHFAEKSKRGW